MNGKKMLPKLTLSYFYKIKSSNYALQPELRLNTLNLLSINTPIEISTALFRLRLKLK